MSAPAAEPEVVQAPPKKGKKKLIIIVAAAFALCGAGGGAFFYMKQKAAAEAAAAAEGEGDEAPLAAATPSGPPTYVPLDAFVVNLADKEADRFAQIGITLQVEDSKVADQMKTYMPAIRNGILMILAHKSSDELLERSGKEQLAGEILVATARALGIPIVDAKADASSAKADVAAPQDGDDDEADANTAKTGKSGKKAKNSPHNPITQVHFSNFIIQ
jgi:flagellar protein FliL